jgi:glutathione S-transferase
MAYRLHYFPIRGRGEQIRLLCHAFAIPFEDVRVGRSEFAELRAKGVSPLAFGSLPVLEDDGFFLVQGPAIMAYLGTKHGARPRDLHAGARCDAYVLGAEDLRIRYFRAFGEDAEKKAEFVRGEWEGRWRPRLDALLAQNDGDRHFIGGELTTADVAIWDVVDAVTNFIPGATLDGAARLQAFSQAFASRPAVAKYLAERPKN